MCFLKKVLVDYAGVFMLCYLMPYCYVGLLNVHFLRGHQKRVDGVSRQQLSIVGLSDW